MNALAWLAPVALPIAGALLWPVVGPARRWLLVLAPLPALLLGVFGAPGPPPQLNWLLLEAIADLDIGSRPLLVMTAFVWMVAGASARRIGDDRPAFASLMLLTCAGNVGVLLAADVVTFYVMFAWMTFAAYGLVVHHRTESARRAGRVYVVLAVLGEVALLAGLLLAATHAGTTAMPEVAGSLATAPGRSMIIGLLIGGFGVKVGLVPLHVWLPLAHPAAPVAASAVLSGTMIKAGLVGWLRILPLGEVALPGFGATLIGLGLVGAVLGVVAGTLQSDPKVLLAYSSVSQMGLITTAVGLGLVLPDDATAAVFAAVAYAVHHGIAKASLFLGVGVHKAGTRGWSHRTLLAGMGLAALALAGAPLTTGWIAKQTLKSVADALPEGGGQPLTLALSLAAAGTTVLMVRLLWLVREPSGPRSSPRSDAPADARGVIAPWASIVVAVAVGGWLLPLAVPDAPSLLPLTTSGLWDGLWPVLLGLVPCAGWLRYRPDRRLARASPRPAIPAGDLLLLIERLAPAVSIPAWWLLHRFDAMERRARTFQDVGRVTVRPGALIDHLEDRLTGWRTAGALYVLIGIAVTVALALGTA